MKFVAVLETESKDAKSVSRALQVDNAGMDELRIDTRAEKGRVVTRLESDRINSLLSSLDDLIKCQMVAEDSINKKD